MGGVTPHVETQNCLCTVCISAWPPNVPTGDQPMSLSVVNLLSSICCARWKVWLLFRCQAKRGFPQRQTWSRMQCEQDTQCMTTIKVISGIDCCKHCGWAVNGGKQFGVPRKTGSHPKTQENIKDGTQQCMWRSDSDSRKRRKFPQIPLSTNPQNAGPEFWAAGRCKGEFGSGIWWGL